MPALDLRSSALDVTFPAGHAFTVALNGPADWLDSRTFNATLAGLSLDVSEDGDQLLIAVDAVTSAAVTQVARFELVGNLEGEVLVGDWAPRTDGTGSTVTETTVNLGPDTSVEVSLILLANPDIVGGGGGVVDEVAASTGIDVDDSDPSAPVISAAPAIATAAADATSKANAAQAAAISAAATDATTKANAAQAAAISAASTDATTKASAAQAAAIASAATDATTKANAAQAAAISAASTDATTKANAAQSAATSAAATDATTKANAAQAAAVQRANHTGTQAVSTVTGLQAALDAKALATDLDTLEADVAALPELVAADPTELDLATAGLITTATLTAEIARTAEAAATVVDQTRPKVVGHYFLPFNSSVTAGTSTLNRLSFHPVWLRAGTIDRIGVDVSTAVATAVGRFGIYEDNGSGEPGDLIAEGTGTQDLNVLGWAPVTISAVLPTTARYHLAFVSQVAAGTMRVVTAGDPLAPITLGTSLPSSNAIVRVSYHNSSVTGALPATASAAAYTNTHNPLFLLRYSA